MNVEIKKKQPNAKLSIRFLHKSQARIGAQEYLWHENTMPEVFYIYTLLIGNYFTP